MRRLFWLGLGYLAGLGSWLWLQRRVRYAFDRYAPTQLRASVAARSRAFADRSRRLNDQARQAVVDLRSAVVDGREAMRQSEARLRADLGDDDLDRNEPSVTGTSPGAGPENTGRQDRRHHHDRAFHGQRRPRTSSR